MHRRVIEGDRNGLLDALAEVKRNLYRAQCILLDTFALLDDLDHDRTLDLSLAGRFTAALTQMSAFLDTVTWEKDTDPSVDHFPGLELSP